MIKKMTKSTFIIAIILICFSNFAFSQTEKKECNDEQIYEGLYSNNPEETKAVLKYCHVSKIHLDPVCNGKGLCKPIIIASLNNLTETVKLLAEAGASINVNGGGSSGDTPLIIALMNGNKELVKYLVEHGADVNLPNNFGATPFWGVCSMQDVELINLFLENGADINYGGRYPDPLEQAKTIVTDITPLMMAAHNGNIEIVSLLLKNEADKKCKDSLGRTAFDYAKDIKIKRLLMN